MAVVSDMDVVEKIKERLISQARRKHKRILPCNGKGSLLDCFTTEDNRILFWFNTEDKNTHVLAHRIGR